MRFARLWAAGLLVRAARFLAGSSPPEVEEEDEELPMPAGHPVVMRSPEAIRMIGEAMAVSPKREQVPDRPLAGSLADRMSRRSP
jgi:hypothetical protein